MAKNRSKHLLEFLYQRVMERGRGGGDRGRGDYVMVGLNVSSGVALCFLIMLSVVLTPRFSPQ